MRPAIVIAFILLCPIAFADTIYVPGDYNTILEGIEAALDGDTVLVAPGTYVENIDFLGKDIWVKSSLGASVTIIDGFDRGSTVTFASGENSEAVLEGFTITNGSGTLYTPTGEYLGGGIYCWAGSSPSLKNNIVTANRADFGAGILCDASSPVITNNVISNNNVYRHGGGIYCGMYASPVIADNTIEGNYKTGFMQGVGGGIYCFENSAPLITRNLIAENITLGTGAGIFCFQGCNATITSNLIMNNEARKNNEYGGFGGGMLINVQLTAPTIANNTLYGNTAAAKGGALFCVGWGPTLEIKNTIFWNNSAPTGDEICMFSYPYCTLSLSYCDIEGGQSSIYVDLGGTLIWDDDSMITDDPCFVDALNGDLHLDWRSPCINRGSNSAAPATDFDGDTMPYMGTADMGADEFAGVHALGADGFTVSESGGGIVNFALNARSQNANRNYLILGTLSGTVPGHALPGGLAVLPINWDDFTDTVLLLINTPPFHNFMGTLDDLGNGSAQLNLPPLNPGSAGQVMHFAYALNNPFDFASNPIAVTVVP